MKYYQYLLFILLSIFFSSNAFSADILHKVIKGEELAKISYKYFGTHQCAHILKKYNTHLQNKDHITPGSKIVIPSSIHCSLNLKRNGKHDFKTIEETTKKVFAKTTSKKKIKKVKTDIQKLKPKLWHMNFIVSPIKFARIDSEKDITVGSNLTFLKGRYELFGKIEHNSFSSTDELNDITVKFASNEATVTFDINNLWGNVTYFALLTYLNKTIGDIEIIEKQLQAGPIGIKYDLIEGGEHIKDLSISYIPLYEYLVENVSNDPTSVLDTGYKRVVTNNIRHSLRLVLKAKFFKKKLYIKDTIFYRPAYLLNEEKMDFKDSLMENKIKFSYYISESFSLSYTNKFIWDQRSKKVHGLPATNLIHKYVMNYGFSF